MYVRPSRMLVVPTLSVMEPLAQTPPVRVDGAVAGIEAAGLIDRPQRDAARRAGNVNAVSVWLAPLPVLSASH